MRLSKNQYYLNIALAVSQRGTCIRRNYGAVIVLQDQIVGTGYTGSPRGRVNCCDTGKCLRNELNIPSGERYELCNSVHAEANAIISAGRDKCIGATLYLVGVNIDGSLIENPEPCQMCERLIINSGIKEVVTKNRIITY